MLTSGILHWSSFFFSVRPSALLNVHLITLCCNCCLRHTSLSGCRLPQLEGWAKGQCILCKVHPNFCNTPVCNDWFCDKMWTSSNFVFRLLGQCSQYFDLLCKLLEGLSSECSKSVTIIDNLFFNAVRENKIDVINRSVNLCITYWLLQRKIRENFRWTRLPCWRMRWRGWGTLSPPYTPTCPTLTTVCWPVTSNSSLHYWPVKGWIQRRMVGVDYLVYSRIQNSMFNYSFLVILK